MLVERLAHDDRLGWVLMVSVKGDPRKNVQVRVTPKGRKVEVL